MHRLAIFGGSFNPPGHHHAQIARELAGHFDEVRVIPCGPRPEKPVTDSVPPVYRATLADIVFGGIAGVTVDLSDFEREVFSRNFELQERFENENELWHVVGAYLIEGGGRGESRIQRTWAHGPRRIFKTDQDVKTASGKSCRWKFQELFKDLEHIHLGHESQE